MWIAFWVTVAVVFTAGCVFWRRGENSGNKTNRGHR
jgi:hypothetical protein